MVPTRSARSELQGMIVVPLSEDKCKTYSLDDFQASLRTTIGKKSKIPGIIELMSRRSKYLKNHPELTYPALFCFGG
jgi:hypothetical protein